VSNFGYDSCAFVLTKAGGDFIIKYRNILAKLLFTLIVCFFAEKPPQKSVTALPIFRLLFWERKGGFRALRSATGVSPPAHDKLLKKFDQNFQKASPLNFEKTFRR